MTIPGSISYTKSAPAGHSMSAGQGTGGGYEPGRREQYGFRVDDNGGCSKPIRFRLARPRSIRRIPCESRIPPLAAITRLIPALGTQMYGREAPEDIADASFLSHVAQT